MSKSAIKRPARSTKAQGLKLAKIKAGGGAALGRIVGVTRQAISKWTEIPPELVVLIEKETGVSRAVLRPDLFA
jgi:DNA-binding transcriptional regulator YdaS (Cro superfamily)